MNSKESETQARNTAEIVARRSYGRLVAFLAARTRDVAAAEDALSEALASARGEWPLKGGPANPEAWLLTVARRKTIDAVRRQHTVETSAGELQVRAEGLAAAANEAEIPDRRLALMFVCAHPAIDAAIRAPLMLQVVLGVDAKTIGSAFLVSPATMGKRLVRAKDKIRQAAIPFSVPEPEQLPGRLDAVLDAIYAAFTEGWTDPGCADVVRRDLAEEAFFLARLVAELLPDEPEAKGLLALLLHCEARRAARRLEDGSFVPLSEQNPDKWSRPMMIEAEQMLAAAVALKRMGRFQLEAAIQSAHAERMRGGCVDWSAIVQLYKGLIAVAPSIGALLGRAAAVAAFGAPQDALVLIEEIPATSVEAHQPYWALRGHVLQRLGKTREAKAAYERAIGLTEDAAVRDFLIRRTLCFEPDP